MVINEDYSRFNYIFIIIIILCFTYSESFSQNKNSITGNRKNLNSNQEDETKLVSKNQKDNIKFFEDNMYGYKKGNCDSQLNCLLPYGICLNSQTCMCMPEYANLDMDENHMSCFYRRKKAVVAGILELFLPFGLGHAYAGHIFLSFTKFIYIMLVYTFAYFLSCKSYATTEEDTLMLNYVFVCLVLACTIPIWNILDMFLYVNGIYRDAKGVPLS